MEDNKSPWVRVYVDLPRDVNMALDVMAAQAGMSKKGMLAKLITDAAPTQKPKGKK